MKKTLIVLLTLVFVLGLAATALAAPANPFVDVPAKHWAYDAVAKLAKAGIVDGYGDGTFRGDKTMTRYEMAQIVAKAMAKEDKASAENKALIDKLAVEFAAELNNLGVRVAKLEANQQNIKFTGSFWTRYTTDDYATAASTGGVGQYRLRMDAVAKVDDQTTFGLRFVSREPDKNAIGNTTWQTFGANGQDGQTTAVGGTPGNTNNIDRVFIATKFGQVATTIGRQALAIDMQSVVMDSGAFSYDGGKLGFKTGDFNWTGNWGRFLKGAHMAGTTVAGVNAPPSYDARFDNMDVASLAVGSTVGKFNYNLAYWNMNNPVLGEAAFKWSIVDTKYTFDPNWTLMGEYIHNGAQKVEATKGDNAWAAKLVYGNFVINKTGDNNFYFQYVNKQANAYLNNFTSLTTSTGNGDLNNINYKEYVYGYNYGFSKNFIGTLEYAYVNGENQASTNNVKQFRAILQVNF